MWLMKKEERNVGLELILCKKLITFFPSIPLFGKKGKKRKRKKRRKRG